ncbi:MAG: WbuC family cupin fold metalloprotein, partial [Bacteroidaceae bacterium]|nr:WbuC family cupin fold metalloprotein [Bacteroidaceae bacterium]
MKIDDRLLDSLTEQAKSSERLRMNMDLRNSPADTSQRMLNAIEPGSQVPIHRHCTTSETVVVLRGRLIEEFYDDLECRCTDAIELSADGPVRALNIPAGQWHTVRVLESGTVIMEVKDGPYIPTSPTDILTISSSASNQPDSSDTSSQPSVSPSDASVRTSSSTSAHTSTRNSALS